MITAGKLRELVGFYPRVDLDDGYGNTQAGFSDEAEFDCPAAIVPKLGGETVLASRLQGTNLVNITVRRSTDTDTITADWRAKNERTGEIYNIRSKIDPLQNQPQHGRWWEMLCEKGVAT